eukprot:g1644.t1
MSRFACSRFRNGLLKGGSLHRRNFRLNADPRITKKIKQAPDIKTPNAPPPPPPLPPPPPPPTPPVEPEGKILGVRRRFMIPVLISLPLSAIQLTERIDEEVVASVDVPMKTQNGVKNIRRDVKLVTGKSGVPFVVGRDSKGRRYMVDENGILFYDSGISQVGWYAVNVDGEITNIFLEDGEVKAQSIGNINELKDFTIDEFMGMPIRKSKITGFRDYELRALPPNTPLVTSKDGKDLIPPFFVDEGEMTLEEEKFSLNPFRKNGKFKFEPIKDDS